jgi:hypothetical protein
MRHRIRLLSYEGDSPVATWDPAVKEEVELAEVEFGRLAQSFLMFSDTTPAVQLKKLDPNVDIIASPQLAGG